MTQVGARSSGSGERLLVWSLAAFQASALVGALALVLYVRGSLGGVLGGLSTPAGLALFAGLWGTTWWSTRRALCRAPAFALDELTGTARLLGQGVFWGAVNGVLFLIWAIAVVIVGAIVSVGASPVSLILIVPYVLFGAPFAALIGAVVGVSFAALVSLLLCLTRVITVAISGETDM